MIHASFLSGGLGAFICIRGHSAFTLVCSVVRLTFYLLYYALCLTHLIYIHNLRCPDGPGSHMNASDQ